MESYCAPAIRLMSIAIIAGLSQFAAVGALFAVGPSLEEKIDVVLNLCLAAGEQQKLEGSVDVDGKIRLTGPTLTASGELLLSQEEWSGLIGGISNTMTDLQADQANRVRDCMAPARESIFNSMFPG